MSLYVEPSSGLLHTPNPHSGLPTDFRPESDTVSRVTKVRISQLVSLQDYHTAGCEGGFRPESDRLSNAFSVPTYCRVQQIIHLWFICEIVLRSAGRQVRFCGGVCAVGFAQRCG